MKNNKTQVNWPMQAAAMLLCLVLLTTSMLSGFYAKFTVKAADVEDARTAFFFVKDDLETQVKNVRVSMTPADGEKTIEVTIVNQSEVAVNYTLTAIKETNNLPITISTAATGTLAPGAEAENVPLTIKWPANDDNNNNNNSYTYSNEIDLITVKLTAVQVD